MKHNVDGKWFGCGYDVHHPRSVAQPQREGRGAHKLFLFRHDMAVIATSTESDFVCVKY